MGPSETQRASSVDDPRVLQMFVAEHSSLQADRSLAYNEAFTRVGMFLSFVSTSLVALALVATAVPIDRGFLAVTALVLALDVAVGLTTYGRVVGVSYEDYRAVHGMNRIRHGYAEIAPAVTRYFTTSTHDDLAGVMVSYGSPPLRGLGAVAYQLTTSAGMTALTVAMIAGVLAFVVAFLVGASVLLGALAGIAGAVALLAGLAAATVRYYLGVQARLEVAFPTPGGVADQQGTSRP